MYVGIQQMEYGGLAAAHLPSMGTFSATGSPFSVAAGRLSFVYGFHGPAVRPCSAAPRSNVEDLLRMPLLDSTLHPAVPESTRARLQQAAQADQHLTAHGVQVSVDTACSSALVGAHQGLAHLCKARAGTALCSGVNLMLAEHTTAATHVAGMLSPEGRCKALDAAADGYVRAEACAMLRLDAGLSGPAGSGAILLKGTAVNQVGPSMPCSLRLSESEPHVVQSFGWVVWSADASHPALSSSSCCRLPTAAAAAA